MIDSPGQMKPDSSEAIETNRRFRVGMFGKCRKMSENVGKCLFDGGKSSQVL